MRFPLILALSLFVIGVACGEEKPSAPAAPAAPQSRGAGEDCVKPDDCLEGLWCLDGRCRQPLNRGMKRGEEMERIQDEHYEQLDNKLRSVEDQMRE